MDMNRRVFIGSALALLAAPYIYSSITGVRGSFATVDFRRKLIKSASLLIRGVGSRSERLITIDEVEDRLLSKSWGDVYNIEDFLQWLGRTANEEYLKGKTARIDGWIFSEVERDILLLALHFKYERGASSQLVVSTYESADLAEFIHVKAWGPQSTCVGMPFNVQSDGHSSHWFSIDPYVGRLVVYISGKPLKTTKSAGLITSKIEGSDFASVTGSHGLLDVELFDPTRNIKQSVGKFEVSLKPPAATTIKGNDSTVFSKISGWGPTTLARSQISGNNNAPIWIGTSCAPRTTVIMVGPLKLQTVVGPKLVTGTFGLVIGDVQLGSHDVILTNVYTDESIFVGKLVILK